MGDEVAVAHDGVDRVLASAIVVTKKRFQVASPLLVERASHLDEPACLRVLNPLKLAHNERGYRRASPLLCVGPIQYPDGVLEKACGEHAQVLAPVTEELGVVAQVFGALHGNLQTVPLPNQIDVLHLVRAKAFVAAVSRRSTNALSAVD